MTPPDSGEREECEICRRPRGADWHHRGETHCWEDMRWKDPRCYRLGYERLAAGVSLPLSLAQRILAALEEIPHISVTMANCDRVRAIAAELRAVVGK